MQKLESGDLAAQNANLINTKSTDAFLELDSSARRQFESETNKNENPAFRDNLIQQENHGAETAFSCLSRLNFYIR